MFNRRSLAVVKEAEERGDPLPDYKERDTELLAIGEMLGMLGKIEPERRAEALIYVINRAELAMPVGRLLMPRLNQQEVTA